ncbi:hypothetical protein [Cupriavidus gilardii]|uniref:DUF7666 domain-containing protein n=1 Tax=Cupriavidus gilardii TaxID=82541 RepID=UPI0021BEDEC8|nr:hypothetical protein [Cupriavidus gilardii]MCT9125381.1 hypothetical protein [Cupriavidus gilardii]
MQDNKTSLVLRTVDHDMTAYGGFKWPESGPVSAPDWKNEPECGNGLHGILWPEGDWGCIKDYGGREKWQVVEVDTESIVKIGGKVKFPRGNVLYTGNMAVALTMISKRWCDDIKAGKHLEGIQATGETVASGNYSRLAASGDASQLAASGNYSRLAASGDYSQLAASGNYSQLAASGNYSRLAASGDASRLAASGNYSRLAASGDASQLAASGNYSRLAASGDYSQLAASGDASQLAASGKKSIAVAAGINSHASAGEDGCIALAWWDESAERYRIEVAYVGEDGIEPDVMYRLDGHHKFVRAE